MTRPSIGVVFRPQSPPEFLREAVIMADQSGIDEVWLWEDCFAEGGVATAAMALAWSERIQVGIGVLPTPFRNPALAAMEAATLARAFPGRFLVGLGHGVPPWMKQIGAWPSSPLTLMREYLTAMRRLLNAETVTVHGDYVELDEVSLDWPPSQPPPILVGATGPKTLALSGEISDGTIITSDFTSERLRAARENIDVGRSQSDRSEPHRIVLYRLASNAPDARSRTIGEQPGHVDEVALLGDAGAVADGIRTWAHQGADSVVLCPLGDETNPANFIRFVADEVMPLVS